ncbi:MAG: class I SAM-dependent methyltransferase [Bacillota bacterium]|nr:class I SAM-dependent methyltransferase [Bacillota bacterium]
MDYATPLLSCLKSTNFPEYFYEYYARIARDPKRLEGNFRRLERAYRLLRPGIILDSGCGFGLNTIWLAMLGIKKVYGLEIESYLLDSANKLARVYGVQDNIEWVLGDVHHLPMSDQSLDGVISFEGIEHFRELAVYFSECYRALRPGDRLCAFGSEFS